MNALHRHFFVVVYVYVEITCQAIPQVNAKTCHRSNATIIRPPSPQLHCWVNTASYMEPSGSVTTHVTDSTRAPALWDDTNARNKEKERSNATIAVCCMQIRNY